MIWTPKPVFLAIVLYCFSILISQWHLLNAYCVPLPIKVLFYPHSLWRTGTEQAEARGVGVPGFLLAPGRLSSVSRRGAPPW